MALSMSRRRAAAPSLIRFRSSGENSTAVSVPASSVAVFFTELTVICLRTPFRMTMRTVCSRSWLTISAQFNKLYESKTRILKDWREKPSLLDTLDDFSDGMCRYSAQLIRYRAAFIERLREEAAPIHGEFSGAGERLGIEYSTVSSVRNPLGPAQEIFYDLCEHQERHRTAEIESQQCLTGAHKDDLIITINGQNARSFASQGQTRTAALSIKLAEREIYLDETGEYPVLLLDDVLSELDMRRQEFVLNRIGGGQTLITCCEDEGISKRTGGKVMHVEKGRIR